MKNIIFTISLCSILSASTILPMKRPAEDSLESLCAKKVYIYTHIYIPQEYTESYEINPILNTQTEIESWDLFNQIDYNPWYMPSNLTTHTEMESEDSDIQIGCTTGYIPPITQLTMIENREPEQNYNKLFWQPSSPSKFKIDWDMSSNLITQTEAEPEDLGIQIDFDTCYIEPITQSTTIETVEPEQNYNQPSWQPSSPSTFTLSSPKKVPNKFSCTFEGCVKTFANKSNLKTHKRIHTGEKYACTFKGCNKSFFQRTGLTAHLKIHTGEKPYKCTFEGCDKSFAQKSNLNNHMHVHADEKNYTCVHCGKSYKDKSNLNTHMRKKHTG